MTAMLLVAAVALAVEPSYLVERVVTNGGVSHRVAVFRSGVMVVVASGPGSPGEVRRRALDETELRVVTQVVEECHEALLDGGYRFERVLGDALEIRLAPPGRPALTVRLPPATVPPLAVARIGQALDELETTLREGPAVREDFAGWVPNVGERIEIEDGREVTVLEIMPGEEDLVIHAQVGEGPAAIYFFLAELRQRAVRRVGP